MISLKTVNLRYSFTHSIGRTASRYFSDKLPKVDIPVESLEFHYTRSSGPGGQNVNKVNTKAELRFHVMSATWLPIEVRERLIDQENNKINKDGTLVLSSQEQRSQTQNRQDCVKKLRHMLALASIEPKDRKMWDGIGVKGKEIRKKEKARRKDVKQNRQRGRYED